MIPNFYFLFFLVEIIINPRPRSFQLTDTVINMRFTEDCCKAKITNLDFPLVPIDKDVVALEVPVDNRGVAAVKIKKPFQNLSAPMLHGFYVHSPVL